jgi:hypothetical protein
MNHFQNITIKHLAFAALIIGMAITTIAVTNSCSSHTAKLAAAVPAEAFQDTIHLVSSPEMASLSSFGAMDTVQLWQSCRCLFTLQQTGQGGDTKFFIVHRIDPDTGFLPLHEITFSAPASGKLHQPYSAWYAFSTVDHFGNTKYDTVRVSGYFK